MDSNYILCGIYKKKKCEDKFGVTDPLMQTNQPKSIGFDTISNLPS